MEPSILREPGVGNGSKRRTKGSDNEDVATLAGVNAKAAQHSAERPGMGL